MIEPAAHLPRYQPSIGTDGMIVCDRPVRIFSDDAGCARYSSQRCRQHASLLRPLGPHTDLSTVVSLPR